MIYLVHRPVSGDLVGMTWDELNDFLAIPDHKGMGIRVETAFEVDEHNCVPIARWFDVDQPVDVQPLD